MALESSLILKNLLPSATLVTVSKGVQIISNGKVVLASRGQTLKLHDRIVVPEGGQAQAVFQEQGGQSLLGTFEGGCDASLMYFTRKNGACSVVFDVLRGQVEMSLSSQSKSIDEGKPSRKAIGLHYYSKPLSIF